MPNKKALLAYAAIGVGFLASSIRSVKKVQNLGPCSPCVDDISRTIASDVQKYLTRHPETILTEDELSLRFLRERYGIDSIWEVPKYHREPTTY